MRPRGLAGLGEAIRSKAAQRRWPTSPALKGARLQPGEVAPWAWPSFHARLKVASCTNSSYPHSAPVWWCYPHFTDGEMRHGKVKHLTQGLPLVSGKAEIQTLAMRLWLPGVLTTVQPRPSMAFMQLINTGKFKCTCSVYIPSAAK